MIEGISQQPYQSRSSWAQEALVAVPVLVILLALAQYSYPLFHTTVEMFSIIVAAGIFMLAWNARRFLANEYLLFVGIGYFAVAVLIVIHAMSYKGVNLFPGYDSDLPTQLWIASRYLLATTLTVAPFTLGRRIDARWVVAGFAAVTAALLASVFVLDCFPACFVEGSGLTAFKRGSEYVISAIFLGGLGLLLLKRHHFEPDVLALLAVSIVAGVASELAFTLYSDPWGPANQAGHLLQVLSFYLAYKAIVETGLVRPYSLLFRELKRGEEHLRLMIDGVRDYAILRLDPDGSVASWNAGAARLKGYRADEIVGKDLSLFYEAEDVRRGVPKSHLAQAAEAGMHESQGWRVRQDGSRFWASVLLSPIRDEEGTLIGFTELTQDVTPRKAAEDRLKRGSELSAGLAEIDNAINSTMDFEEIMQRVVSMAARTMGSDTVAVSMREGGEWTVSFVHGLSSAIVGRRISPAEGAHMNLAAERREPVVVDDAEGDPRVNPALMRELGIRSLVTVPLIMRDEPIGVLTFHQLGEPRPFTADDVDFARKLAASVSLAVENARLYQGERLIADTLQSALVSVKTELPEIEVGSVYRSATELARIGGDFFDVFELDGERAAFVLGDVSGKGIQAATLTAVARSTLRAFAYGDPRPSAVLSSANDALFRQLEDTRFITAIYGVVDFSTGTMRLASAGHTDPFACGGTSCTVLKAPRNPPLGVLPEIDYAPFETQLEPAHALVFYSDGLTETRRGAEQFGEEGIARVLAAVAEASPQQIANALLEAAIDFSGGELDDDIAILVFRRKTR